MLTYRSLAWAAILAVVMPAAWSRADGTIDATRAVRVSLPSAGDAPVTFKTPDGKEGWVRRLGNQTIPTPAYANGKIYTGAGMSSTAFYAINADTGRTIWKKTTTDNGPTSPIVSEGLVAYNTESCDTETRDAETGEMSWHETTGGSLLTQPVVVNNVLAIPHPTMARRQGVTEDAFRMLVVDLKTGKHFMDENMTADVLGAPVSAGDRMFFTCTDGRVFCLRLAGEGRNWHVVAKATSAPVVVGDTLAVTTEEPSGNGAMVSIRRYTMNEGNVIDEKPIASTAVGKAVLTTGQRAEWDYQGPKIVATGKQLFNAPGQTINSVDVESGKALWKTTVSGNGLTNAANSLTPPALGKANLYLGSTKGHVLAVKQSDGTLAFGYNVGEPLASQPILAEGNLYFGTANGLLVCIKLNDPDAKDWHAWGGNAQHNKVD